MGVASHLNKDKINKMMERKYPDLHPRDNSYIGIRMTLVSTWYNKQEEKTREAWMQLAKEWTAAGPPEDVKRK